MNNICKIFIPILLCVILVLSSKLYIISEKLEAYRSIHYMDTVYINKQDSLIDALYQLKVTKIIIIDKDTVR